MPPYDSRNDPRWPLPLSGGGNWLDLVASIRAGGDEQERSLKAKEAAELERAGEPNPWPGPAEWLPEFMRGWMQPPAYERQHGGTLSVERDPHTALDLPVGPQEALSLAKLLARPLTEGALSGLPLAMGEVFWRQPWKNALVFRGMPGRPGKETSILRKILESPDEVRTFQEQPASIVTPSVLGGAYSEGPLFHAKAPGSLKSAAYADMWSSEGPSVPNMFKITERTRRQQEELSAVADEIYARQQAIAKAIPRQRMFDAYRTALQLPEETLPDRALLRKLYSEWIEAGRPHDLIYNTEASRLANAFPTEAVEASWKSSARKRLERRWDELRATRNELEAREQTFAPPARRYFAPDTSGERLDLTSTGQFVVKPKDITLPELFQKQMERLQLNPADSGAAYNEVLLRYPFPRHAGREQIAGIRVNPTEPSPELLDIARKYDLPLYAWPSAVGRENASRGALARGLLDPMRGDWVPREWPGLGEVMTSSEIPRLWRDLQTHYGHEMME